MYCGKRLPNEGCILQFTLTIMKVSGRVIWSRNYVAKDIEFGTKARAAMLFGVNHLADAVNHLADAVKVTMGPKGRNVNMTKHGSTTCATVLTQEIFTEGCKSVAAGVNVMDLRSGITMAVSGRVIWSRNYVAKDIEFGTKARAAMLFGVNHLADAVKVTMGPNKAGCPKVTKDGVTVAKSINFEEKAKNVGTTCATVLTQEIFTEGCKSIAAGVNVMDLRSGITMAVNAVIADLKSQAVMISTPEEITPVQELEHPLIFIHDKKISDMNSLVRILELAVEKRRPLLIVAEDLESELLAMLIINKRQAGLKVCAIKFPGFGDNRRANLEYIAVPTGGEVR
ncbi:chaperonin CPN60-like protein 2, mitochondrial [Tanacetum coccineum]